MIPPGLAPGQFLEYRCAARIGLDCKGVFRPQLRFGALVQCFACEEGAQLRRIVTWIINPPDPDRELMLVNRMRFWLLRRRILLRSLGMAQNVARAEEAGAPGQIPRIV
jgi:hypothetical protein